MTEQSVIIPADTPRLQETECFAQAKMWSQRPDVTSILDAIGQIVLVLNAQRQIVFANEAAVAVVGAQSVEQIIGLRPGDSLACERARLSPAGCGSGDGCKMCGALRSITDAENGRSCDHECRLLQFGTARALHFKASAKAIHLDGTHYTLLTLTDMTSEHRRHQLERIFFHDLLNTVGAISGYLQLMDSVDDDDQEQMSQSLMRLTDTLVEEIRSQRDLVLAENGELPVRLSEVSTLAILKEVAATYRNQPLATGKFIFVGEGSVNRTLSTDRALLLRVLGNLVKNALEASASGDHVLIGCEAAASGQIAFWVHNRAAMPPEVRLQVFHRAFTTKGTGRGLGTYSVRLLTTRYLNGEVSVTSTPDHGTRFTVTLPLSVSVEEAMDSSASARVAS